MVQSSSVAVVEYLNLRASSEELAEMGGGVALVSVSRADMVSVSLGRGISTERPVVAVLCGVVTFVTGLWGLSRLQALLEAGGLFDHGDLLPSLVVLAVALAPLGAAMMYRAVRTSFYLEVHTKTGRRKLTINGTVRAGSLEAFASSAKELGYSIEIPNRLKAALE